MNERDFIYWLQGFLEMSNPRTLNAKQTATLKAHLALVFEHAIDPSYVEDLPPAEREAEMNRLQSIHDGEEVDEKPVPASEVPPEIRRMVDATTRRNQRGLNPHTVYKC